MIQSSWRRLPSPSEDIASLLCGQVLPWARESSLRMGTDVLSETTGMADYLFRFRLRVWVVIRLPTARFGVVSHI